jgi:hypothetical protein
MKHKRADSFESALCVSCCELDVRHASLVRAENHEQNEGASDDGNDDVDHRWTSEAWSLFRWRDLRFHASLDAGFL